MYWTQTTYSDHTSSYNAVTAKLWNTNIRQYKTHSLQKKTFIVSWWNYPVWIVYNFFLCVDECNSSSSTGFPILGEETLSCPHRTLQCIHMFNCLAACQLLSDSFLSLSFSTSTSNVSWIVCCSHDTSSTTWLQFSYHRCCIQFITLNSITTNNIFKL